MSEISDFRLIPASYQDYRQCRQCGEDVKQKFGKRPKLYCSAKCKKRWQRQQKKLAEVNRDKPKLSRIDKPKLKCRCGEDLKVLSKDVWIVLGIAQACCPKCHLQHQYVRTTKGWSKV